MVRRKASSDAGMSSLLLRKDVVICEKLFVGTSGADRNAIAGLAMKVVGGAEAVQKLAVLVERGVGWRKKSDTFGVTTT